MDIFHDECWVIDGDDLVAVLDELLLCPGDTNKISIMIDGGVKFKVNEDGWSLPYGHLKG